MQQEEDNYHLTSTDFATTMLPEKSRKAKRKPEKRLAWHKNFSIFNE